MTQPSFNLLTDPWIQVIVSDTAKSKLVSLLDLFKNASGYREIAGDMRAQDLAILRLSLAVLHTVYSRYDANNQPYPWQTLNDETMMPTTDIDGDDFDSDYVFETWHQLHQSGQFTDKLPEYLKLHQAAFDLFGERPFYQVTATEYDQLVPNAKRIANGKGTVSIKQMNRRISESGNSQAVFSPKTDAFKNQLSLAEFARWLVTYQNYTGVTDKTKIENFEKFSNGPGWLYRINPVYLKGNTLFETLMLNLILVQGNDSDYVNQKPVWEYQKAVDYIDTLRDTLQPDNIAALYTNWSRALHVQWESETKTPTIFSAGLPSFDDTQLYLEPMTTWRYRKLDDHYHPARRRISMVPAGMWRQFGDYIKTDQSNVNQQPRIITWVNRLKNHDFIDSHQMLTLVSTTLIDDGNATSQSPALEYGDEMVIEADVLFDPRQDGSWPAHIEQAVKDAQNVGFIYQNFVRDIATIRNIKSSDFIQQEVEQYYARLNYPFNQWLSSLTYQDDSDVKLTEWRQIVKRVVTDRSRQFISPIAPRDVQGITQEKTGLLNVFIAINRFNGRTNAALSLTKG